MAGFDVSPAESEYGFSRPHLIGLGVLSLGVAAAIGISAILNEEPAPRPESPIAAVKPRTPRPVEPVLESPAFSIPEDAKPAIAEVTREKFLRRKKIAIEHKLAIAAASSPKLASAAVAEKPISPANLFPNWNHLIEFELQDDLWNRVPTIGMNDKQALKAIEEVKSTMEKGGRPDAPEDVLASILGKKMIQELPIRKGSECKLEQSAAQSLQRTSQSLHRSIAGIERTAPRITSRPSQSFSQMESYSEGFAPKLRQLLRSSEYQKHGSVRALTQILQTEPAPVREVLVQILDSRMEPKVSRLLLDRAVYDLSQDVRHAANQALKKRPLHEFRSELLKALRYPWEPVAAHAAETLMMVNDQKAVPALIDLLDLPDPSAPIRDKSGKFVVRELVKINHMRNCLLCHAPTQDARDLVAAPIPVPGEPLRPVYYGSHRFRSSSGSLVRADVTYLRQDFSIVHEMENQKPWPQRQRFDYLVRTREATPKEVAAWDRKSPKEKQNYSQREAVLTALRSITRKDLGYDADAWREATANSP